MFNGTRSRVHRQYPKFDDHRHVPAVMVDEGFRKMISTFNPKYTLPSRIYFKKMMEKKLEQITGKLKDIHKDTDSIALTADLWTSIAAEAYLGSEVSA